MAKWTLSYAFLNECCFKLDHLSDQHRLSLESNIHEQEQSNSENEDEGGEDNNDSECHDMELTLLSRKRIIRSSDGNRITSYRDLAGIRRREKRRQISEIENNDDLVSARRDNPEFQ